MLYITKFIQYNNWEYFWIMNLILKNEHVKTLSLYFVHIKYVMIKFFFASSSWVIIH